LAGASIEEQASSDRRLADRALPGEVVCPVADLQWAFVRLRPLTEAECYARCYGGWRGEANVVRVLAQHESRAPFAGEQLAELLDHSARPREPGHGLEAA